MLRGNWKGKTLGSGSDAWKYWDERRAGKISDKDWVAVEDEATAALVLDTLDGAEIDGFGFALQNRGGNRRADLVVDHPVWSPGHWREDRPVDSRAVVAAGHSATRSAPDS